MEKLDLLYDHYKETNEISLEAQKKRGKLFVGLCLFELLNFFVLLFPNEIAISISQYIHSQYSVGFILSIAVLQSSTWIAISYAMVRYFQTNIYIERQYSYIAVLEGKLSDLIDEPCIKRESDSYLANYPRILNIISAVYTWVIPILIILVNLIKTIMEWRICVNVWSVVFDTVCCAFCVVLSVTYLIAMHPRSKH